MRSRKLLDMARRKPKRTNGGNVTAKAERLSACRAWYHEWTGGELPSTWALAKAQKGKRDEWDLELERLRTALKTDERKRASGAVATQRSRGGQTAAEAAHGSAAPASQTADERLATNAMRMRQPASQTADAARKRQPASLAANAARMRQPASLAANAVRKRQARLAAQPARQPPDEAAAEALLQVNLMYCAPIVHGSRQVRYMSALSPESRDDVDFVEIVVVAAAAGAAETATTRFDAALYDHDAELQAAIARVEQDIDTFVNVTDDDTVRMAQEFVEAQQLEMHVCGLCGSRDPDVKYARERLDNLPAGHWVRVPAAKLADLAPALDEEFELLTKAGASVTCRRRDLLNMHVCARSGDGYHVVELALLGGPPGQLECMVCPDCGPSLSNPKPAAGGAATFPHAGNAESHFPARGIRPDFNTLDALYSAEAPQHVGSIAAGWDLGRLSRLDELGVPRPSVFEQMVLSTCRCHYVTTKVVANNRSVPILSTVAI